MKDMLTDVRPAHATRRPRCTRGVAGFTSDQRRSAPRRRLDGRDNGVVIRAGIIERWNAKVWGRGCWPGWFASVPWISGVSGPWGNGRWRTTTSLFPQFGRRNSVNEL